MLFGKSGHSLNQEIEAFIHHKDLNRESYSKDEISYIRQYSGSGGKGSQGATGKGILHEYYTPELISENMWKLAHHYGFGGGTVLEPALGTGNLIADAPDYSKVVGFEINPVSARIAEIAFPGVTVHPGYFETAFLSSPRFVKRLPGFSSWLEQYPFDLVISNPPFGKYANFYSSFFRKPSIPTFEATFIYYGLQLLRPGGLLVYLIPSNFLRNGNTYNVVKAEIGTLATFIDAFRLPPAVEKTEIPLDILILKRK